MAKCNQLTSLPFKRVKSVVRGQECREHVNCLRDRYDRRLVRDLPRDRHVVLDRYLQSWKYFVDVDAELRRLFRFDEDVLRAASSALTLAVGSSDHRDALKVGLHVRRGDVAQQDQLIRLGYVVADMSYIERAMDYMDRHLGVDSNTGYDCHTHGRRSHRSWGRHDPPLLEAKGTGGHNLGIIHISHVALITPYTNVNAANIRIRLT